MIFFWLGLHTNSFYSDYGVNFFLLKLHGNISLLGLQGCFFLLGLHGKIFDSDYRVKFLGLDYMVRFYTRITGWICCWLGLHGEIFYSNYRVNLFWLGLFSKIFCYASSYSILYTGQSLRLDRLAEFQTSIALRLASLFLLGIRGWAEPEPGIFADTGILAYLFEQVHVQGI